MGVRTLAANKNFTQSAASDVWTIQHNLGYNPAVLARVMHEGALTGILPKSIEFPDVNTVVLRWSVARSGEVTLA